MLAATDTASQLSYRLHPGPLPLVFVQLAHSGDKVSEEGWKLEAVEYRLTLKLGEGDIKSPLAVYFDDSRS